jgi:hydrogenase expression/formation protein HypE
MAEREGLEFESRIESDSMPLADLVLRLLDSGVELHCLRDITRGGLSSVLNELAESAELPMRVEETRIPVREDVRGACEILGLDPLQVACEGRFVAFVPEPEAERALEIIRSHPAGAGASVIGCVLPEGRPMVILKGVIGAERILDMASGEQLPRIC